MKAMVLEQIGKPLVLKELPTPVPKPHELLLKVKSCGVCRTDVHIADGELLHPKLPLILGHQVVGEVVAVGQNVTKFKLQGRVGMPWLGSTCQACEFCHAGKENLCDKAIFTGYLRDGGYAEYCTVHEDYALALPESYDDVHAAPLLCAGLVGFRAYRLALGTAQGPKNIGFYGFGSSAHILIQLAKAEGHQIYVFTKPHDKEKQAFATSLGAVWAGGSDEKPPVLLDAALIFAPAGALYPVALQALKKGGSVVSAGIHMSDIPTFSYNQLWGERSMTSCANLTRQDGHDFLELAKTIPINVQVHTYRLEEANQAHQAIREGTSFGSSVLIL